MAVVHACLKRVEKLELRDWCKSRLGCGDGLYLACLLLRNGILKEDAFGAMYDDENLRKAIHDALETGFTMVHDGVLEVPPACREALKTSHSSLDLPVWKLLQTPSAGIEKKLVLLALLPEIARIVTPDNFGQVFTPYVGNVARTVCYFRGYGGVRLRMDRVTQSSKKAATKILDSLGAEIWQQFAKVTREVKEADELCARLLLFCVRYGILQKLFPKLEVLSRLEKGTVDRLFEKTVREFASGTEAGYRGSLTRFLFAFAGRCGLVDDALKVAMLYSAFRDGSEGKFSCGRGLGTAKDTYAGCLPVPDSSLSDADAGLVYRRLVEFCAEHGVASKCMDILKKGLKDGMTLRSKARIDADPDLKRAVFDVVDSMSFTVKPKDQPLLDSLRSIAVFVAIQYLAPCEDHEAAKRSVPQFRSLVNAIQACVEAVCNTDGSVADGEPTAVEKIAHLLTELCAHESASFGHIAVKAVEALGHRLDDAVTAVLFDAVEAYVSGSGVAETENAEEEEEEDDDDDDDEGEDEEDEETEDAERESAIVKDKLGEEQENSSSDGEEGDDEDDSDVQMERKVDECKHGTDDDASGDDTDPEMNVTNNEKDDGEGDRKDEDSADDADGMPDVDMDPDDEDPEVLAQFDRRLAMHIKLLNKEKKKTKQRKLRAQFRFTQASRVLSLIESVAKILRIRIETDSKVDQRTLVVFLDLHSRLFEFALSDEAENGRFLSQICTIARKQMMISPSFFTGRVSDSETVSEIAKRFLQSLRDCSIERKPSQEETKTISKSAGYVIGAAAALRADGYAQFLPLYKDLVRLALLPQHPVNAGMLISFFRRAPAEVAILFKIVKDTLEEEGTQKNVRTLGSEVILELAEAAREASESGDKRIGKFWDTLESFLLSSVTSSSVKAWRPLAITNLVHTASHGIRGRRFRDSEVLSTSMSEAVNNPSVKRAERLRLLKLLRVPDEVKSAKRKQSTENQAENDTNNEENTTARKRKRSKRAK